MEGGRSGGMAILAHFSGDSNVGARAEMRVSKVSSWVCERGSESGCGWRAGSLTRWRVGR